jgi:uncharacterized protein YndB with AHSA1/START domain
MDAKRESDEKYRTTAERTSEREFVVTRTFKGPAHLVFAAWTRPDLIMRWWAPKSIGMSFVSCDVDLRTGGTYRFVFRHASSPEPVAFFGRYLEVTPPSRLVWTNDESGEAGGVTTVTFEEGGDETLVVIHDLYPSKEALEAAAFGAAEGFKETFGQLDELLVTLGASGRS